MTAIGRISQALLAALIVFVLVPVGSALAVAPSIEITNPSAGSTTNNEAPSIEGMTSDSTDPVAVSIYTAAEPLFPAQTLIVSPEAGAWQAQATPLVDGAYLAKVEQGSEGEFGTAEAAFTVETIPQVSIGPVTSPTNSTTPTFGGTLGSAAGDLQEVAITVHLGSIGGPEVASGAATVSGSTWSFTTSPALSNESEPYFVQAVQLDQAGHKGEASASFMLDTKPPTPVINTPNAGETLKKSRPIFSGSTSAGDTTPIAIEIYSGKTISGTPQVLKVEHSGTSWTTGGSGPALTNGPYVVRAKQADAVGNVGMSLPVAFSVESPSPAVTLNVLPSFINDRTPSFSGSADTSEAEPHVTLKIWRGTSASGTLAQAPLTVAENAGAWAAGPAKDLPDGTYTAQAEQPAEAGGNPPGFSNASIFTVDTVAPVPTLSAPPASTGVETVSGLAGDEPSDSHQIVVELFSGSVAEPAQAFETITVIRAGGTWSATFAGLGSGEYTAVARQSDEAGNSGVSLPSTFAVSAPPAAASPSLSAPVASFTWVPASPVVGQSVSLVSNSIDASSAISAFAWDAAETGQLTPGGPLMTTTFATAGPHVVRLQVTDANGLSGVVAKTIVVSPQPLTLMQPFPIVRIAGVETSNGVKIRLLTVQAPATTKVTVTCKGRGCKTKSESRVAVASSKSKIKTGAVMLSFARFERSLRAGAVLQIRVSKAGQIGKFTSFTIRRHKLPLRTDSCLRPTSPAPIACPAS